MSWIAAISALSSSGTKSGTVTGGTLGIDGKVTSGASSGGAGTGNIGILSKLGGKSAAQSNAEAGFANPSGANYQDATKMTNPYAFYGGETCDDIRKMSPVKIIGSPKVITTNDEKCFYNNVVIPRKKV